MKILYNGTLQGQAIVVSKVPIKNFDKLSDASQKI
jgi:hypothetical protein